MTDWAGMTDGASFIFIDLFAENRKKTRLAMIATFLFSATSALADERADTVAKCVSAFASGNGSAYTEATTAIRDWGEITDPNLKQAAMACLSLSSGEMAANVFSTLNASESAGSEAIQPSDRVGDHLIRLKVDPNSIETIAKEIADGRAFVGTNEEKLQRLETALLAYAQPLPASKATENLTAYLALSRVDPEDVSYRDKVAHYSAAIEDQARADEERKAKIASRLIKKTAEFDGSSWYRHPSSPRYQDIQPYVTLYVLETGSGQRSLEFFVNYTSRNGWLFVESAQINVDGEITRLPASTWSRDNDTEIWEWTGYRNQPEMIVLAKDIAESKRAVVRFNGQHRGIAFGSDRPR